jgi:hypothetical protein
MSTANMYVPGMDLEVLRQGDKYTATAGPLMRQTGWIAGQWLMYSTVQVPPVSEFTMEKSTGIYTTGFTLFGSENYTNPRQSTYRNYTSYQNRGTEEAVASGASVITIVAGGGRFLFSNYERIALDAFGVRAGGPAVYNVNLPLKVSENGLLCQDPDAFLLLATGGTDVLVIGVCSKTPTTADPRLGLDLKY